MNRSGETGRANATNQATRSTERLERVRRWAVALVLLLVGWLAGTASRTATAPEPAPATARFDLYWKSDARPDARFVGTTSFGTSPGEEFWIRGLGGAAVLLFCGDRDERNPCGADGPGPGSEPDSAGVTLGSKGRVRQSDERAKEVKRGVDA